MLCITHLTFLFERACVCWGGGIYHVPACLLFHCWQDPSDVGSALKVAVAFLIGGWWLGSRHLKPNPGFLSTVEVCWSGWEVGRVGGATFYLCSQSALLNDFSFMAI